MLQNSVTSILNGNETLQVSPVEQCTTQDIADLANMKGTGINVMSKMFGESVGGGGDDTAAFNAALALCAQSGLPLFLGPPPSGAFNIGDVFVPSGVSIYGINPADYVAVSTKVIVKAKHGAYGVFDLAGSNTILMEGFNIDGNGQSSIGIYGNSIVYGGCFLTLRDVGFQNCSNAIGDNNYFQGIKALACSFYNNNIGVYATIDSQWVDCTWNVQSSDGVNLPPGANNNEFSICRWEFNLGNGMVINDATGITVSGIFDRNYKNGLLITSSSHTVAAIVKSGTIFSRNGRNGVAGQQSHIYFNGNPYSVSIGNIYTATGADDGGGGPTTPAYCLDVEIAGGSTGNLTIIGADLRGNTTGGINGAVNNYILFESYVIKGCAGIPDATGGYLINRSVQGDYYDLGGSHINGGATATYAIALPSQNTFTQTRYRLCYGWTDATSGALYGGEWLFSIQRAGGAASEPVWANAISAEIGTAGLSVIGTGTAGKVSLSASAIAIDGSSFTLSVNNQLSGGDALGSFDFIVRPA